MRIIVATGNAGKMKEIKDILASVDGEILSAKDLGLSLESEETGATFSENAYIKAHELYELLKERGLLLSEDIVIADDSGIEIDFLGGRPGVQSARFLGHDTPYRVKNERILDIMKDVPESLRGARFVCHITALSVNGERFDFEDSMPGMIARSRRGSEGFGYDPIFYLPELKKTSGELSEEEKNRVSHRGKVLRHMRDILAEKGIIKKKQIFLKETEKKNERTEAENC